MKEFGVQMDIPEFLEEPEKEEEVNFGEEKITPIIPEREKFEQECPVCGLLASDTNSPLGCQYCERGKAVYQKYREAQKRVSQGKGNSNWLRSNKFNKKKAS
jgi:rubrerythrin